MTTIKVGPGEAFTRIQAALDGAGSGAMIEVLAGTYAERIIIRKPVKLHGQRAILDGLADGLDGRYVGIEVDANNVRWRGTHHGSEQRSSR